MPVHLTQTKSYRPCQSSPASDLQKLEKLFLRNTLSTPALDESIDVLTHIGIYQVAHGVAVTGVDKIDIAPIVIYTVYG